MKVALAVIASIAAVVAVAGPLDARLTFSLDGGESWSDDFPFVSSGTVVRVRVAYTIVDSWERRLPISADIHASAPFASHTHEKRKGDYMQRHPQNCKSSRVPGEYVWKLDTGGLSVGTHVFMLEIGYGRTDEQGRDVGRITDSQPFYLTVN